MPDAIGIGGFSTDSIETPEGILNQTGDPLLNQDGTPILNQAD
jgi:hypothetical protein